MCIGAIKHARIKTIVFGAFEQKKMYEYKIEEILNKTEIIGGFMQAESEQLLKDFFSKRR